MAGLSTTLSGLNEDHASALNWFDTNAGKRVKWASLQEHADEGMRLATLAKGIYKPAYTDYALSVRQTLNSPYADKEIVQRANGGWVYPYFQENPDPMQRDREATNRGLVKCMQDAVPVGVLIQAKPKPGVEYDVLGLAQVSDWRDGYFILEGIVNGATEAPRSNDAARAMAVADALPVTTDSFDPRTIEDKRERVVAEIIRRRGQPKFRKKLLSAYGGRCAITGCDAAEALEAAHITPYNGDDTDHPQNGLLLRSDIHTLFDLGLIAVDELSGRILISPSLVGTKYERFAARKIAEPTNPGDRPSYAAVKDHREWAGLPGSSDA